MSAKQCWDCGMRFDRVVGEDDADGWTPIEFLTGPRKGEREDAHYFAVARSGGEQ